MVMQRSLSVRETEELVRRARQGGDRKQRRSSKRQAADAALTALCERMQRALGTRVRIRQGRAGGGRIEVEYYDRDDLERIAGLMASGD